MFMSIVSIELLTVQYVLSARWQGPLMCCKKGGWALNVYRVRDVVSAYHPRIFDISSFLIWNNTIYVSYKH